jgi:hypothetical protein
LTGIEVNLKSIDDKFPYRYPSRTLEITTPQGRLETPVRAATHYEYRSKMQLPAIAPIDNPVAISTRSMNFSQLHSFLNSNESFEPLLRRIELHSRIGQYARLKLTLIHPTITDDPIRALPAGMQVLQTNPDLRDRFIRFIIKLQQEAGFEFIAIPPLELPFNTLSSVLTDIHKSVTIIGLEPVFFVDFRYNEFQNLISHLVENLQSKLVGLIYRRFSQAPVNYDFLSRTYYDRDVAFICAQVNRYDMRFDDISSSHYMPFFGTDIYSVEIPPPFYDEDIAERSTAISSDTSTAPASTVPRLQKIRFFDRSNLKVKPLDSGLISAERIVEDMKSEDRDHAEMVLQNREEVNSDHRKFLTLNALSKFHELRTSALEFEGLRKHIDDGSTKDYLERKSSLTPALAEIRKRT